MWDKALTYCRQAGAKAAARPAYREAVGYLEQALGVLEHLPESRGVLEQAIDLRLDLRHSLARQGEFRQILVRLGEAETVAQVLGDRHRLAQVSNHMADYFQLMGDYDRALEAGQRALTLIVALEDVPLQAMTHEHLGVIYYQLGDYRRAIAFLRQSVASLEGEWLRERCGTEVPAAVESRTRLALCLAEVGAFAKGMACGEEALRMAEAVNHPLSLARACYGVGFVALNKGDLHQAIPILERGLVLCQAWDIRDWFLVLAVALGYAYALSGRLAEALPLLEQGVEQDAMRRRHPYALWIARLSEGYVLAGRLVDALPLARQALALAHDHKEQGNQTYALRLLGEIAIHRAPLDVDEAAAQYRQALTRAEALGMRPLQAHCHRGLGALYAKTGRQEQARAALSSAIKMYRAMDMTFWLRQAEAALAQVEGQ
jgi:tetratricopeptide (TPR) repeat protein